MLSYPTEMKTSLNEALPIQGTRASLSNFVSTNPKAISRLISAAIVDRSFQKLLLTQPDEAMTRGYNGEIFDLTEEDRAMILTIQAASINDFAAQLVRLRENNCSGEWIVRNNKPREKGAFPMIVAAEPVWSIASLPAS